MEIAVSLPDELFASAEAAARELRVTRSELYAKAIAEFLERTESDRVTNKLTRFTLRMSQKSILS
jgi:metal-responsive CopG/Arc/MetJ family transcriptional regulator